MDEIRQFSKLRYLRIQAPNHSILTHSAISDAICEKKELEYLQIEFLRKKLELPNNFCMNLDGLSEAFKAQFYESYIEKIEEYNHIQKYGEVNPAVQPKENLDIFNLIEPQSKEKAKIVFKWNNKDSNIDKSEIFDPLTRALVSCKRLKSCQFTSQGHACFDRDPFVKSYMRAFNNAKVSSSNHNEQEDDEAFSVSLMHVDGLKGSNKTIISSFFS